MAHEIQPYIPRQVRPLGVHGLDDWRVKLHGLYATGDTTTDPAVLDAALSAAAEALPKPAEDGGRYGVGFVIVHRTPDVYSYLVGWWSYNCLLSTAAYTARHSEPGVVGRSPARQAGCVWELALIDHERRAWTEMVMRSGGVADLDAYLAAVLDGEV